MVSRASGRRRSTDDHPRLRPNNRVNGVIIVVVVI
jgi:hypothetical protein